MYLMEKKEPPTLKKIQRIQLMFMEHLNWKEKRRYKNIVKKHYIIRTSWLYSQYGQNFYNTILRFVNEGKSITVTTEQTGTPTNANDLAEVILNIIASDSKKYGIYNYSNEGEATWYDFAKEILTQTGQLTQTNLVKTDYYRTFAQETSV